MSKSSSLAPRVTLGWMLSSITLLIMLLSTPVRAHEVLPAIADMTQVEDRLEFDIRLNVEGLLSGIDLSAVEDTNAAAEAENYDALRELGPEEIADRFARFWPEMRSKIIIEANGELLPLELVSIEVPEVGNPELVRTSELSFVAQLPAGASAVDVGWAKEFGTLILRQQGVEQPYDGYLDAGSSSGPIQLSGGDQASAWQIFLRYIPVGFEHIIPLGLDHILFVLGLYFLAARLRPLLWQITAFTLAHTITLALAALGYVNVPGSIVEPLIAASIVFVAVENMMTDHLNRWRPLVVFGFGLLHGLGFASVLGEFGLPDGAFIPALIGFNIGVEVGQLTVIAVAFLLVGLWFRHRPWYRRVITTPGSAAIALIASWWFVERTFL
jgi:hydrogenase/urease accessory protein HupE